MRRVAFLIGSILLATAAAPASDKDTAAPKPRLGDSPAYAALGRLPVLHHGRVKPLDTMARLEVRDVYGPGDVTIPGQHGEKATKWGQVATLLDWSARPDYWNQQEIILVDLWDYRGFKQELLAEPIKAELRTIAAQSTNDAAKQAIDALLKKDAIAEKDLNALLAAKVLDQPSAAKLVPWAEKLAEGRKRVAPEVLQTALLKDGERKIAFEEWFSEVYPKGMQAEQSEGMIKLSPREDFVFQVGKRLKKFQGYRDKNVLAEPAMEIPVIPRPHGEAYLKYTGSLIQEMADAAKARQRPEGQSSFDEDVVNSLGGYLASYTKPEAYLGDVMAGKQQMPGANPKFDRSFAKWLREASNWIPLRLVLDSDLDELAQAGLPKDKVQAVRNAYAALESAEQAAPGEMALAPAEAFVKAAGELGAVTSPAKYPTAGKMSLETHFNQLNPFGQAPLYYGVSLVLLLISLGVSARPGTTMSHVDRLLYWGGIAGLVAGIALEAYGFYLRIAISGWAPVTNMYETVVWVAFVAAVLGLILEAIFRRKYAATAASGIALVATLLAANVPLLEPNIGQLAPVLRDNFWLTVHVLTIVSSYAAFSLVMGLGMLGVAYYLSATYRRDVPFRSLAQPLFYGLPLVLLGLGFYLGIHNRAYLQSLSQTDAGWIAAGIVTPGAFLCVMSLTAMMGELANRRSKLAATIGLAVMLAGAGLAVWTYEKVPPAGWPAELPLWFLPGVASVAGFAQIVLAGLGDRSRRVLVEAQSPSATSSDLANQDAPNGKPLSVAERVKQASAATRVDPRGLAIQATVNQVKPLANFIYRAMQVGVLLVATGTFLGGWWADKSWGRFWGWDPKEVWALITLIVYLIPLHGRFAGWVNTFGLVAASVVCYNSVLMAWYGVNWVLGVGLHSYGFSEGGGQGMVVSTSLAIIAIVSGAALRRALGSKAARTAPAPSTVLTGKTATAAATA